MTFTLKIALINKLFNVYFEATQYFLFKRVKP